MSPFVQNRTLEAHTVGSGVIVGEPLETFGKGRKCIACPTILSVYNDKDMCRPCSKLRKAEERRRGEWESVRLAEAKAEAKRLRDAPKPRSKYRVTRQDIIDILTEFPGSRANEVAPRLGAKPRAMGALMRNMVKDGQLTREDCGTGTILGGHKYFVA